MLRRISGKAVELNADSSGLGALWHAARESGPTGPQAGAAETLAGETLANSYLTGNQTNPAIARLTGGGFILTWVSAGQDGSGDGIYAQRFAADGTPAGAEFRVNSVTSGDQRNPAVAGLEGGGFVISWEGRTTANSLDVHAQRFDAAGAAQGGQLTVNTTLASAQSLSSVAGLPGGGFVVAWQSLNAQETADVYVRRYDAAGAPLDGEIRANTYLTSNQELPDVTVLVGGGFVVTWTSNGQDGSGEGIYAQRFSAAGAPVGVEFRVNTTTASNQRVPDVVALEGGGFVVVWVGNAINAQVYDASGNAVGGEIMVANAFTGAAVTALADGGFAVAWEVFSTGGSGDGAGYGVFARAYAANGVPQGAAFPVNQTAAGDQRTGGPNSLVQLADGSLVVAWAGAGEGDGSGIFLRGFALSGPSAPITGTAGPDVLTGTGGDDLLEGGGGDDSINGLGGSDTARYSGQQADYQVVALGNGAYRISDLRSGAPDGIDTLRNVEFLSFAGGAPVAIADAVDPLAGDPRLATLGGEIALDGISYALSEIVALGGGGFAVLRVDVGVQSGQNQLAIHVQRYSATGVETGPEITVTDLSSTTEDTGLGFTGLSDGGFVLAWPRDLGTGNNALVARRYDADGQPVGAEFVVANYTLAGSNETNIVELANGDIVITYSRQPGAGTPDIEGPRLYARIYGDTGVGGAEIAITTPPRIPGDSDTAALANGGFVTIWRESTSGEFRIEAQVFNAQGNAVGSILNLQATTSNLFKVVGLEGGGFALVYQAGDIFEADLYARIFSASGTPQGAAFPVSLMAGAQELTGAVALDDGGFAISYTSGTDAWTQLFGADGSPSGGATLIDEVPGAIRISGGLAQLSSGGFAFLLEEPFESDNDFDRTLSVRVAHPIEGGGTPAPEALGGETRVNSTIPGFQGSSTIAALEGGGYVIVYIDGIDLDDEGLSARVYNAAGQPVGPEFLIARIEFGSEEYVPSVTGLAGGGFAVIYPPVDQQQVRVQRYDALGNPVGASILVSATEGGGSDDPVIIGTPDGGFFAIYEPPAAGNDPTWGRRYDANGNAVGAAFEITSQAAENQAAAILANGDLVVAWEGYQPTTLIPTVFVRLFDANGVAKTPAFAMDLPDVVIGLPSVAALANGTFVVSWDGADGDVRAQLFDANGATLGGRFTINQSLAGEQWYGFLEPLADGGFVASWTGEGDGSGYGVYARIFNADGSPRGNEFLVNQTTQGFQGSAPRNLAQLADGSLAFTWERFGDQPGQEDDEGVFMRVFDRPAIGGGSGDDTGLTALGGETRINPDAALNQVGTKIAALADGNYVTFWYELVSTGGSDYFLYGQIWSPYATRIGEVIALGQVAEADQGDVFDVAGLAGGGFVVTYAPEGASGLRLQRFGSNGTPMGAPSVLPQSSGSEAPDIVSEPGGGFFALYDGVQGNILAQRFGPDGTAMGSSFTVSDSALEIGADLLANGDLVMTWTQVVNDGSGVPVYARIMAADGTPRGPAFLVHDVATLSRSNPAVEALSDGRFVVSWSSGGDGAAVFRIFGADGTPLSATIIVDPGFAGDEINGTIVETGDGGFLIVYDAIGKDGSDLGMFARRYGADGQPIGPAQQVAQTCAGIQTGGSATLLADGSVAFAWTGNGTQSGQADDLGTFVRIFAVDGGGPVLGAPPPPLGDEGLIGPGGVPMIAALSGGGYAVGWLTVNGGLTDLNVQVFTGNGTPVGSPLNLGGHDFTSDSCYPSLAALDNGGFVLAWVKETLGSTDTPIVAQRFDASGAPAGPLLTLSADSGDYDPVVVAMPGGGYLVIHGQNGATGMTATVFSANDEPIGQYALPMLAPNEPAAVLLADGRLVVAHDPSGGPVAIVVVGPTGTVLNTATSTMAGQSLSAAALANGKVVLTFEEGNDVFVQLYDPATNALTAPTRVATANAGGQDLPTVHALADGGFVVSWESRGSQVNGFDVYARLFRADGAPTSDVFLVNQSTTGDQRGLFDNVAQLANNDLVFAWWGAGAEGAGIYTRRFDLPGPPPPATAITGTSGPDTLDGTAADDLIEGLGANDVLRGLGGNDLLDGGTGADRMEGGGGNDSFLVDQAGDVVVELGGEGDDRVYASVSYTLAAGVSVETLSTDWNAGTGAIDLTGNELANMIIGNAGANVLSGGAGDDVLDGKAGNDILYGGANDDTLHGSEGNDILHGGAGTNYLAGGAGDDQYVVDSATDIVVELAGQGNDRIYASISYRLAAGVSVEILSTDFNAGTAAIDLTGNALANTLYGNDGANVLNGGGGADFMDGKGGDDLYVVDHAGDAVAEAAGGGTDRLFASVSYALTAGAWVETLSTMDHAGTAAINLTGNELANTIFGNAGANLLTGGAGNDLLDGKAGNDILSGGANDDTLYGREGNDQLFGGSGTNYLAGGAGDDLYFIDSAADFVVEAAGQGNDRIHASVSYILRTGVSVEILSTDFNAGTAAINLTGNELANTLYGNAGANILLGGGGDDLLEGRDGNDRLHGGTGTNLLVGGLGDDFYVIDSATDTVVEAAGQGADRIHASVSYTLAAGVSVEILSTNNNGGTASLNFTGNELANTLFGNEGANILNGGGGGDFLEGKGGADTYQFTTALGPNNVDIVSGFQSGVDRIALDDAIFTQLNSPGALNLNAFHTGTAAADASDRIIYDNFTGRLFYDADGTGGTAAVLFATLQGAPVLAASDFVVI